MLWLRSSVPLIGSERTQNSAVLFLLASKACGEGLRLSFFFLVLLSRAVESSEASESRRSGPQRIPEL